MCSNTKKNGSKVGFKLVFVGLLFFFNPCVNIFDVFPDVFGAILIYLGLRKQAYIDGYFEDARKLSFYLIFVYFAKLCFSLTIFSNPGNSLPYTFIASVVELIFLLTFIHKLFSGFEYTLMRSTGKMDRIRTNEPYAFAMIFSVVKCVGVVVVELFELLTQGGDLDLSANANYYYSLANSKKYAIVLCVFIQLVLGIIYIFMMSGFFRSIKKHPTYLKELSEKYNEDLSVNKSKHISLSLSAGYILMILSVIFVYDLYIEGFDVLPDVFIWVFMLLSFIVMKSAVGYVKLPVVSLVLFAVISIVQTGFSAFVNPERFIILSEQLSMFEYHSSGFFKSFNAVVVTASISLAIAGIFIIMVYKWICANKLIYQKELLGNHDRKLVTVAILSVLGMVVKGICNTLEAACAVLAQRSTVASFISDRPVLTEEAMTELISSSQDVATFVSIENAVFVLSLLAIIFVVFSVFNIFALKSQVLKDEK